MNENLNYSTTFSDYFAYRNKRNMPSCLDAATRSQTESREGEKLPTYMHLIPPFEDMLIKMRISFIFA